MRCLAVDILCLTIFASLSKRLMYEPTGTGRPRGLSRPTRSRINTRNSLIGQPLQYSDVYIAYTMKRIHPKELEGKPDFGKTLVYFYYVHLINSTFRFFQATSSTHVPLFMNFFLATCKIVVKITIDRGKTPRDEHDFQNQLLLH